MKLDLFTEGDSVLLVGEGNFSFSSELLKHQLLINVVATCFEESVSYEKQAENIEFLKSKNVPIFFNVDATKLHENPQIRSRRFSKVVFNFPHVGGKMKIQLNRQLLKDFFKSACHILGDGGIVLISLCRGQGGTPADRPQRKWSDSWQVTEMAAHGGFYLTRVVPFPREQFKKYTCVGYRSQDVKFNMEGALVHVFVKKTLPFDSITTQTIADRFAGSPLTGDTHTPVPIAYSELYAKNPMLNPKSPVSFVRDLLVSDLIPFVPGRKLKILTDTEVPVHISAHLDNDVCNLRREVSDVLSVVLKFCGSVGVVFFPGTYFPSISPRELFEKPSINIKFLVVGTDLSEAIRSHMENLIKLFKEDETTVLKMEERSSNELINKIKFSVTKTTKLICWNVKTVESFTMGSILVLSHEGKNVECCILNIDVICKYFYKVVSWKELWSDGSEVILDHEGKPILKHRLLFPSSFKLDVTLRHDAKTTFCVDKLYHILWLAAAWLIEEVEFVNEYESGKNWCSRCYRIVYKSIDKPLCREHAVKIHSNLVAPMLELGMNVTIG